MTSTEVSIRFFERHLKEDILKYGERQAIHMAIAALREQEEKEPCEACKFFADAREQDFGLYESVVFEFCPVCGRRLEEV